MRDGWFGANRIYRSGYETYIFSQYRYWRYYDVVNLNQGFIDHFLKMENDTYLAEVLIRTQGSKAEIARLINNSRVNLGELSPLTDNESYKKLDAAAAGLDQRRQMGRNEE